jgi:superfamily II DNA/RNA helicase
MAMPADKTKLGLYKNELEMLENISNLSKTVTINGKAKTLFKLLKKCFAHLKKAKYPEKAIIYVDNIVTMGHLKTCLSEQGYSALTFSGENSRDFDLIEQFRNDKKTQILIATVTVTKGLDLEFCSLVVIYDLLSNALELEQCISRCHRQGQQADVLVINLFNKYNDADIRYLELINKRTLQFEGIFGLSDTVLGNFEADINEVLSKLRKPRGIKESFSQNLIDNEQENIEIIENALDTLFTTFTKEVAEQVTLTPQYIESETRRINDELWTVVKWFFEDYNHAHEDCFDIDERQRTIALRRIALQKDEKAALLFYYVTGSRNKPYYTSSRFIFQADMPFNITFSENW